MMAVSVPSRRVLALAFGLLLTVYSVSWMYLVRQESAVAVGVDSVFRPICGCLELTEVTPGGPADRAGLRAGDRVRSLDGRPLTRYEPFLDLRRYGVPGQRVVVELERGGTRLERTVEMRLEPSLVLAGRRPSSGCSRAARPWWRSCCSSTTSMAWA